MRIIYCFLLYTVCASLHAAELSTEIIKSAFGPNEKIKITASSWEQKAHGGWANFPPVATRDNDFGNKSSWHAEGDGEWIQFTLPEARAFDFLAIAFVQGNKRQYTFSVHGSDDEKEWITLIDKKRSSGTKTGFEHFEMNKESFQYIRIIGHGNTNEKFGKWINIVEVDFLNKG